ncbi:MAG: heat-inducible transcriptional repressor HrcA [Pyrinomonadaceae bacterium]|nr:heat-inducible transcriptional repressor HrcA [Pyrinomonadaceae bacterium]MCX7639253.1 heat-inducible transcriptional repressor HrcA [Pyrinomonadaceae bacterium]MDW8303525.1 heat-inducible transcriptional repressor HrcA [Acidobacteriota bacterium]
MLSHNTKRKEEFPDSRGRAVLSAVIHEHLLTGEPVGSKTIAEKFSYSYGWSPATIRNVMSELEDAGLLEQPHTSAGRVPTDEGYRFYVDNLLGVLKLTEEDLRLINEYLSDEDDPEKLMEKSCLLLSTISENVGIVALPSMSNDLLEHIEFFNLSDKRILVMMISSPNIVHNKIIRLEENISQEELNRTARYLNAEFRGKSLIAIRNEILRLMHEERALFDKLLQTAIILCSQSIENDELGQVYVEGTANILSKRDFNFEQLQALLKTFEEKTRLVRILNECISSDVSNKDVKIMIGKENLAPSMQNCSLITTSYRIGSGEAFGTIGVVGPTRIEYARVISVVSYVARLLEKLMSRKT